MWYELPATNCCSQKTSLEIACHYAGINISGINGEVMPGQWEYQVGPGQCSSLLAQRVHVPLSAVGSVVHRFDKPQRYQHVIKSCRIEDGFEMRMGRLRDVNIISGLPMATNTGRLDMQDDERHVTRCPHQRQSESKYTENNNSDASSVKSPINGPSEHLKTAALPKTESKIVIDTSKFLNEEDFEGKDETSSSNQVQIEDENWETRFPNTGAGIW